MFNPNTLDNALKCYVLVDGGCRHGEKNVYPHDHVMHTAVIGE